MHEVALAQLHSKMLYKGRHNSSSIGPFRAILFGKGKGGPGEMDGQHDGPQREEVTKRVSIQAEEFSRRLTAMGQSRLAVAATGGRRWIACVDRGSAALG